MSTFPPPPPGLNLSANQQPQLRGSIIGTRILALFTVGLRFFARRVSKAGFWLDDWLMIPAIVCATILCFISTTWMIDYGLGKHVWLAPLPTALVVFFQSLFISELCYTGVMVSVKFSILALYWRLFKLSIRVPILILASIVTCWGIAVFLTTVFQCVPVRGFWDKTINATCGVNVYAFFYGNSIPNISTDVAILILPMPLIWRLRIPQSQKIMLSGIFILGGFIIAVSITRLIYLINLDLHSPDVTWNFGVTQIWTCVEMNIAVVCGCLPSLRPILSLTLTGSLNPSFRQPNVALLGTSSPNRDASWSNAKSSTTIFAGDGSASKATSADNSKNRYAGLSDHKNGKFGKTNGSENPSVNTSIKEVRDMNGISGIRVQNDIGIQWHATGGN